jgi:hypothetical protein
VAAVLLVLEQPQAVRAAAVRVVLGQPVGLAVAQTRAVVAVVPAVTMLLVAQAVLVLWLFVI